MTKVSHCKFILCFPLIWFSTIAEGQGQSIRVEAGFEPATITLGGQTTYKITLYGAQEAPEGILPSVNGLNFSQNPRFARSFRIINGVASTQAETSFVVQATKQGVFNVPAWEIKVNEETHLVPSATLRVLPPSQQDLQREKVRRKRESDLRHACFLEIDLSREYLYEGETIMGTISLFTSEILPVSGVVRYPQQNGPAFSQSQINQKTKPVVNQNVARNGKLYTVYSWPAALTAAMKGTHDLQYSMTVAVRVRERSSSPIDPFINDPFFGFGREQNINVNSEKLSLEVKALPMTGRPDSFRGAIGSFESILKLSPSKVSIGDPVTLTFVVKGKGNFEAIRSPEISRLDTIKTSPPRFHFEGDDNLKFEGSKKFEYVLTPNQAGQFEIPSIPFSFFDPEAETYLDASTKSRTLQVGPGGFVAKPEKTISKPEETQTKPSETFANPKEDLTTKEKSEKETDQIKFQFHNDLGNPSDSLVSSSFLNNRIFWYAQIAPFACFVMLLSWKLRKGSSSSQSKRLSTLRKEMKDARNLKDASRFFRATNRVIREIVGPIVNHERPQALASDDVIAILQQVNYSKQTQAEAKELLNAADAHEFAETNDKNIPLNEWFNRVHRLIRRIRAES